MTKLRPHKVAHKGRVEAAGFLFNTDLIGVAETRRRILSLWESGVQVFADGPNYFVRLSSTIRVDSANCVATPLVQIEDVLSALPLSKDEFELLQAPSHSVVFTKGGVVHLAQLSSVSAEAPEKWLDVTAFEVVKVSTLGAAFAEPKVVGEPLPFDARAKLDGVPAEASERREALAAIKLAASGKGQQSGDGSPVQELLGWLGGLIGLIPSGLARLARFQLSADRGFTTRYRTSDDQGPLTKENPWLTRLGLRLLHTSRLARLLGRRQAAYLGKMMDMFQRGDLNEALKHAIPLGDLTSLNQRPALGAPSPRNSLSILPWQGRSSRSIGLENDVLSYLYQLYRASFQRLEAQNRIEEAAFVLAELLRANEEAVAFLERHGKLKLAAELAEGRELWPGLVVRQWFIAGDIDRAVEIARRTNAFADAVLRLEKKDKDQAEKLRIVWAASLAEAGNYAGAVDVIWPVEAHRQTARKWMEKAIEVGGPVAGRMLARKLSIVPEDFDDIRRKALTFLEDESYELRETRMSFAEALFNGENTREARTLARVAARAILRDAGQNSSALNAKQFNRLVNFSGDGPLRTDVPLFPVEHDQPVTPLFAIRCVAADCGTMPVHDALLLPNGRMLVALGEIGARLLTRDGRTVTHFDQPAEKLVISDNGARAIALARRGEVWRLSRLDLIEWRAEDWCDAQIDAFAPSYDGSLWFLGAKGDFYAIDAHAKSFEALWRVPEAGSRVLSVARSESSCSFLTASSDGSDLEQWIYALPLLTLRRRSSPPRLPENVVRINYCDAFSPEGVYADQSLYCVVDHSQPESMQMMPLSSLKLRVFEGEVQKLDFTVGNESCAPLVPEVFGRWVVSPVLANDVMRVGVINLQSQDVTAELFLTNAKQVSTRLTENTLTVADDLGRVIVVDLRRNCSIRNFRI
ncbi:MAG TPA: bpX6 domain-containing protein [Pyrinomonadaceae bacterium]|nr:bpX6 domain-containing protein [Pyrinomonadaceae bacterium]